MTQPAWLQDEVRPHRAVIGLGANLADPVAALRGAVAAFAETAGTEVLACSQVYRTDPIGGPQQPRYLNAVMIIHTDADPDALLDLAHRIEGAWGRVREERWGPRTLDIDLIDVDGATVSGAELTLPHPRAHERGFVLVPWLEIDPDAVLPGAGRVDELVDQVDCSGIETTGLDLMAGLPGRSR